MKHSAIGRRLAGALFLGLIALPTSVQSAPGIASGLPWSSGVTRSSGGFGAWRGRPIDVEAVFFGKRTWKHIRATGKSRPGRVRMSIGFPMLPVSHRGQLQQCANGAFDPWIRDIRDTMLANGWGGSYLRLGWEANRVDHSLFPWAAKGNGRSYVGCFRRWVGILNPGRRKNFTIVWNMANEGTFPHSIERLWPGSDVVDVVGSNFYDRCPTITSDAQFRQRVSERDKWGNPAGPKAWIEWARARGKKWALPEWGIGGSRTVCNRPGKDNPFFITKMHEFLRANARHIAFETYFNGRDSHTGTHALYPSRANPKAARAYRGLW
jgi:hypothetical protein